MKRPPPRFRPLLARSERISGIAMKRAGTPCDNRLGRDSQSGGRGFDPPAVHQLRKPRMPWGKPGVSAQQRLVVCRHPVLVHALSADYGGITSHITREARLGEEGPPLARQGGPTSKKSLALRRVLALVTRRLQGWLLR